MTNERVLTTMLELFVPSLYIKAKQALHSEIWSPLFPLLALLFHMACCFISFRSLLKYHLPREALPIILHKITMPTTVTHFPNKTLGLIISLEDFEYNSIVLTSSRILRNKFSLL